MDVKAALKGQYHAALAMLRQAIELCPASQWNRPEDEVPYWRVVYHTLYFTDLYLSPTLADFTPWALHRDDYHDLPWPPGSGSIIEDPYTQPQLLEYWKQVDAGVDSRVEALDLSARESGIPWHQMMPKLDHQLHNIRHIQHHTALLSGRLRRCGAGEVEWRRYA